MIVKTHIFFAIAFAISTISFANCGVVSAAEIVNTLDSIPPIEHKFPFRV